MAQINGIIPPQKFEILRDKIGEILAVEIKNQFDLTNDKDFDTTVWLERFIPLDKTEISAVIVALSRGDDDGHTQYDADYTYTYNIDIFANAKATGLDGADKLSKFRLHKLMRVVRAILHNPVYKTLDLDPPIIFHRFIREFQIDEIEARDGLNSSMCRMQLVVKSNEDVQLIDPSLFAGNDTTVKLGETEKGYKYIL